MASSNKNLNNFFLKNKFLGSYESIASIPELVVKKECCFIGRSNVGKSSLINAITKTKKLAKTSKTPGRTQSINIFEINNKINLVVLPGYGFAKVSKIKRENLMLLIEDYIKKRNNLSHIYLLIDSKVGLKNSDIDMIDYINYCKKTFSIILTKIDKVSKNDINLRNKSIISLMKNYKKMFKSIYFSETKKNNGIIDIQKSIYKLTE